MADAATEAGNIDTTDEEPIEARRPFDPPAGIEWISLFNGKDLGGWTITQIRYVPIR